RGLQSFLRDPERIFELRRPNYRRKLQSEEVQAVVAHLGMAPVMLLAGSARRPNPAIHDSKGTSSFYISVQGIAGCIMNTRTARSQYLGAIIWCFSSSC